MPTPHFKDEMMLVLSRKKNECILVGEGENQIKIMVVEIDRGKVRIGIEAPLTMGVHRQEIYDILTLEEREVENVRHQAKAAKKAKTAGSNSSK